MGAGSASRGPRASRIDGARYRLASRRAVARLAPPASGGVFGEWERLPANRVYLAPGDYTFRVRGSNNDGVWTEQGVALRLRSLPPPWRTSWAYALYLLLLGGVVAGNAHSQARKRQRAEELARSVEELQALGEVSQAREVFVEYKTAVSGMPNIPSGRDSNWANRMLIKCDQLLLKR